MHPQAAFWIRHLMQAPCFRTFATCCRRFDSNLARLGLRKIGTVRRLGVPALWPPSRLFRDRHSQHMEDNLDFQERLSWLSHLSHYWGGIEIIEAERQWLSRKSLLHKLMHHNPQGGLDICRLGSTTASTGSNWNTELGNTTGRQTHHKG